MRISDWSSDVCSSDLNNRASNPVVRRVILSEFQQILTKTARDFLQQRTPLQSLSQSEARPEHHDAEIGRASCRERVCQYVSISVVAVPLQKTKVKQHQTAKTQTHIKTQQYNKK